MPQSNMSIAVADSLASWVDQFSERELLARLRNTEDNFVERKTKKDKRDWLPAAVAFANSVPIDYPAVLFIGARDDGTLEGGDCNFESLQKSFNRELADAYPPIYTLPRMLKEGEKECLAVIIPGSRDRPHFAGPSYVRVGAETRRASEAEFAVLIAERNAKVYEIRKCLGKTVDLTYHKRSGAGRASVPRFAVVVDANQFYVTLRTFDKTAETVAAMRRLGDRAAKGRPVSVPLSRIELCYDLKDDMLRLEVRDEP